jgi:phosphatidylglycerophosphate synthase
MGLSVEHADHLPSLSGEVLVASGNVLVTAADLQHVIGDRGRLVTRDGQRLPLGVLDGLSEDWQARLDRAREVSALDLAALVTRDSARRVELAYWASLTSSSDGFVDRHFNRPVGRLLSKMLVGTSVTPNQVSLFATLVGLVSASLFAAGTAGTVLAGALVLQLSAVLDCVDGDLARALYKQSSFGRWLDIVGDQIVHIAVFLGIGVGLWRSGSAAPVLVLGIVAAGGVVLSFLVVMRALLNPGVRGHGRLQKLIDATTNRDFSVLLILFALLGVVDWFLWLAAVGSHVFWLVAAALQYQESRAQPLSASGQASQDHAETT